MKKISLVFAAVLLTSTGAGIFSGGCSKTPDEQVHDLYVQTLNQINQFEYVEAESSIAKIGEVMSSSPWIPLARGIAFEQRLEYWDALQQYHAARSTVTDFAPSYDRSARLFSRLGLWEDAIDDAYDCAKYSPSDPEAWILVARCAIGGRLFDRVFQALASAEEHGAPKEQTAFIAAQCLFERGDWDSASALSSGISVTGKTAPAVLMAAADYFETAGQWDSSIALSRSAMASANHDFDAVHDHFYRSLRTKHFVDARNVIDRYKEENADSMLVCGLEMLCFQAEGHRLAGAIYADSYRAFARIQDISPVYWIVRMRDYQTDAVLCEQEIRAIETLMERGNWLPAFQQYIKDLITVEVPMSMFNATLAERFSAVKQPWSQRRKYKSEQARLHDRWRQFKEFDSAMADMKQYHVGDADWTANIADVYGSMPWSYGDSARVWYTKALSEQKWRPETFLKFVRMYERLRKYDSAIAVFERFPQYEQHLPHLALTRAAYEVRLGRVDKGLALFTERYSAAAGAAVYADTMLQLLRKVDAEDKTTRVYELLSSPSLSDNTDAIMLLADMAWKNGDFERSLDLSEKAASIEPRNGTALACKARALYGVGKKEESFALFEKILLEHPRTTKAYMYYSQLLANDPSQYEKAANWARAACVETDGRLQERLNLCETYYRIGKYDFMFGEASKLLPLHPDESDPSYWVGMGLYLKKRDGAKGYLEKSIALGLIGEKLQKARETLLKL